MDEYDRDRSRRWEQRLRAARSAIEQRYAERLTVPELARQAGVSCFHFSRRFRLSVGRTPHAYLVATRMDHAARLLRETRLPVREIARRVGVRHGSHFTVAFRRAHGVPPSDYRRRARQEEVDVRAQPGDLPGAQQHAAAMTPEVAS